MPNKATETAEALIAPLKKQLDKAVADEDFHLMINVVKELHKVKVTKEALEKTRIGIVVNKLRLKKENAELAELSKEVINGWKTQLAKEKEKKGASHAKGKEATPKSTGTETATEKKEKEKEKEKETESPATSRKNAPVAASSASPKTSRANPKAKRSNSISNITRTNSSGNFDEMKYRATMKEKFSDALEAGEDQKETAKTVGDSIEEALFTSCGGITDDYKSKLRSYLFNLKDAKNSSLRSNLLAGYLEPSDFVTMTAEELANPELKEWRIKTEKQLAINAQSGPPESEQQTTDMFKCGKCGQRKTSYYQLQTRSADEPMTTFITCVNCGNRWKQY